MLSLLLLDAAHALTPTGGVAAGVLVHPEGNDLATGPTVVGRLGLSVIPHVWVEANVGWSAATTKERNYAYTLWNPRIDVAWGFLPEEVVNPFVRGGFGGQAVRWTREKDPEDPADFGFVNRSGAFLLEVGGGTFVHIAGPLHLRADLMFVPSFGDRDEAESGIDIFGNLEATLGVDFRVVSSNDRDGDGIKNRVDQCPDEMEDIDSFDDTDGCPDRDNDADDVIDTNDTCRDQAEDKDGFEDGDGCPDPDNDKDGVLDGADTCPEPEDPDGFEDTDGCPDLDNDKDGVADTSDKCRDEPETSNGYRDRDGCPDEVPEAVKKFSGKIEGITFETGKAIIKKESNKVLDAAVKVLKEHEDVRLEVQGHTDDVGDDAKNHTLSHARAEAVVAYFVKAGIPADRLVAKGYGETKPMVPNENDKSRQQNRRVEFVLIP